jgi:phosphopantetheinyl transferase (holo-ACP synthase)
MIRLSELPHETRDSVRHWNLSGLLWDGASSVILRENITQKPARVVSSAKPQSPFLSRSYSGSFVAEMESKHHCGIDIELGTSSSGNWSIHSEHFVKAVLAPNELPLLLQTPWAKQPFFETQIWASKEAFAKASGDASQYEPNELISPMTWFPLTFAKRRAANLNFETDEGECLILWVVELKAYR